MSLPMPRLSDVAARLGTSLYGADASFARVISDTRQLQAGDLFVALVGERFDGHDYLAEAARLGAVGAIVSKLVDAPIAQIVVADTLAGLQDYARSWRGDFAGAVVGITGSNGKTTTKQLVAAVLAARGSVLATEGNLNNHIGVPLTLARLRDQASAVIEMGANHPGEIAALAAIARPRIGVVTQAGDAHLEGFGSRAGVARAKGEMFESLGEGGIAIINADDAYAGLWSQLAGAARPIRFGLSPQADVRADDIAQHEFDDGRSGMRFMLSTPDGRAPVLMPLPGRHNVLNALAAAACGHALGLSPQQIADGIAQVQPPKGRVGYKLTAGGARVIDDSYNANPTSLAAGLQLLAAMPGQRWAVLGGMGELGPQSDALHAEAGRLAQALGLDRLYAVGPMAAHYASGYGGQARIYSTHEALAQALLADLAGVADAQALALLVKGSRAARMETIVQALVGGADGGMH